MFLNRSTGFKVTGLLRGMNSGSGISKSASNPLARASGCEATMTAARNAEARLQIMTLSALAAHLAGGLLRATGPQELEPAIRAAIDGYQPEQVALAAGDERIADAEAFIANLG